MQRLIKAILFDIGGTLRVTNPNEGRDLARVSELMALVGIESSVDDFMARIRRGEKSYRRWCKPNYIELPEAELWSRFLLPEYPEAFIRENAVRLNQLWRESRRKYVLPDMAATMRELSQRGYKLGLISNTTSSIEGYQLLDETGLTELFSSVILSAEFGRRKPHPSLFTEAARRAGVEPGECAYVGDRPSRDLIGARQAAYGAAVIINTEGYTTDEYDPDDYDPEKDAHLEIKPDYWIRRLTELLAIFPGVHSAGAAESKTAPSYRLYDVALSTMWHVDQSVPFNETFETARKIGISRSELNHQVTPQHLAGWERDLNYISTVHDPCPAPESLEQLKENDTLVSSLDEAKRRAAVDLVKHTLDFAVALGARSVVLHSGSVQCDRSRDRQLRKLFDAGLRDADEFASLRDEMVRHRAHFAPPHLEALKKSLLELIEFSRGSGVTIGVENRYRYYDLPLPDEMEQILLLSDENHFGFQLDTGHAHALEALGVCEKNTWLTRFGSRIIGVHLHDVRGLKDHQVPGRGEVDFSLIATHLPENCQKTMEITPHATPDEIAKGLKYLETTGCIASY